MTVPKFLRPAIRDVVHELTAGNYELLERDGRTGRLTASEVRDAIQEYGRTLIDLPAVAFDEGGDSFQINNSRWAVDQDLWTAEDGHSDLTLELDAVVTADGTWSVVITDLHMQ